MKKRFSNKNFLITLGILVLLVFAFLVGTHFFREEEVVPEIEKNPVVLPNEGEMEFVNESSLSDDEIWNIVNDKRENLRILFYESEVYEPSEIDSLIYTEDDNDKFVIFGSLFLQNLKELVTEDIYNEFFYQMTLVKDEYYIAEKNIFDKVYLDSVIAEIDVTSSDLRLILATDDLINANVTLNYCEDSTEKCDKKIQVPFELKFEDGIWKISDYIKKEF